MKPFFSTLLLLSLIPSVQAAEPELIITTPAIVRGQRPAVISGTATDAASVTWAVTLEVEGARGRRIFFRAVDVAGKESDIRGLRFRRGS